MAHIRVVTTRAPGLIPSLIKEIDHASNPVVLIPESFTLACETEIVNRSRDGGIFDLKIFSPSSLIREVRELTGHGNKKPISGDGQNMIISQVLHHYRDELKYYRDSVAQPTLAAKIAVQTVKVAVKVSEAGKIYGSVTAAQLADALVAAGVEVDKKDITVPEVKELCAYEAVVKVYKAVKATLAFEVVAE